MFASEIEMSEIFEDFTKKNFGNAYIKEFQGLFGIPDFLLYDKKCNELSIISFELKLKNWKRAIKQAFKYKSFSNISYVVLPANSAKSAQNNLDLFKQYNVGLAIFTPDNSFDILYKPELSEPFSDDLINKVSNQVKNSRKRLKNLEVLYT
jgi:hypothetical protein